MYTKKPHILVVGAGLAGLSASLEIEKNGGSVTLIEKSEAIGGRVKTDLLDGFLLDHGFQVLLTSYPELKPLNVINSLGVRAFDSGAVCHKGEGTYTLFNPFRHFPKFLLNLFHPPKEMYSDFFKLAQVLRSSSTFCESTDTILKRYAISSETINTFLKPFFGGVFLDTSLQTEGELFRKYLKLFLKGQATLPANGMRALPQFLSDQLTQTELFLNSQVKEVADGFVSLESGKKVFGDAVIVAVDNPASESLLGFKKTESQSVTCFYFSVPADKIQKTKLLHLGAEGPVTNLCLPNHIQPSYAPKGKDLISATVVKPEWQDQADLKEAVHDTVCRWFSLKDRDVQFLKEYRIKHALPNQASSPLHYGETSTSGFDQVFLAGECVNTPSINGALESGRKAAKAVFKFCKSLNR